MKAKVNDRQTIWMIAASVFVLTVLNVTAQAQSQWETSGNNTYYNSGNVGIGTNGPAAKLQVDGSDGGSQLAVKIQSSSNQLRIYPYLDATYGTYITSRNSSDIYKPLSFEASSFHFGVGSVGIGTTSPGALLEVRKASGEGLRVSSGNAANFTYSSIGRTGVDAFFGVAGASDHFWTGTAQGDAVLKMNTSAKLHIGSNQSAPEMTFSGGSVGIGKTNPTVALDVFGDINLTGTINAKYQDVAEWVPSSEQLAAGTVVVLDPTKSNQVIASTASYDTRVAGVISAQPGIALGEKGEGKVLVATTGRVKIKVDATKSPIRIGDLLVTSDVPGVAMKSEAINLGGVQIHRPGTLIGKALEPLEKGKGEILVLLSLQ